MRRISTVAEFNQLLATSPFVLVDFTAAWCGPCQYIAPIVEKLALEHTHIVFVAVDVDEAADIAAAYSVQAMPTFKLFGNGQELGTVRGAAEIALKALINKAK
eukprot:c11008_g1_i1.p1 GENE.c11008_g1_i1~~c11008_g1_i1.p1  ORF type:complete len:103 (+),score=14.22 c11008_g1_i1:39-347(+)